MLRVIRQRLADSACDNSPVPRRLISATCARCTPPSTAVAPSLHTENSEPYGMEYGAGPSRIPYDATALAGPLPPGREAIHRACAIRRHLSSIESTGQYASSSILETHLRKALHAPRASEMSRVELHTMLHQLLGAGQSMLALSIVSGVIDAGQTSSPPVRREVSTRTLRALLAAERTRQSSLKPQHITGGRVGPMRYRIMLDLLRSLQSIRHHRPIELYLLLVHMSIADRRPDKAAEIFVGLVEEWVTEGRVAEGADIEGFYEGGGPPRILSRESLANRNKSWWTGVRTWTLPGEVLSPHDRLDLWHPAKLSLGRKFKNFPFPVATSPPSVVPSPTAKLLDPILSSLRLDPSVAAPADFEASMRACAILANTILSRTLPLSSLGPLLHALQKTPPQPPVYPTTLDPIPENDAWAYEAFTQVHLALQSFFFSPPISAASFALARANNAILAGTPVTTHAHKYRLQPLSMADVIILVRYALEKMRMVELIERMARYMKRTFSFGWKRPVFWNALLRGATVTGDKGVAQLADDALFKRTQLARTDPPEAEAITDPPGADIPSTPLPLSLIRPGRVRGESSAANANLLSILQPPPNIVVQADEESLVALLHHLGRTSQFDRLVAITYKLIPYLQDSRKDEETDTPLPVRSRSTARARRRAGHGHASSLVYNESALSDSPESESLDVTKGSESTYGNSGRRLPQHLSPQMYSALLTSLSLSGRTGLAQRVFTLACSAEKAWIANLLARYPNVTHKHLPSSCLLPLPVFAAMLRVWHAEIGGRAEADVSKSYPLGWIPPASLAGQTRQVAAQHMAQKVYLQAAARFAYPRPVIIDAQTRRQAEKRGLKAGSHSPDTTPDAQFFDIALSALAPILGFRRSIPDLGPAETGLFERLVSDMQIFGVSVPPAVRARLDLARRGEAGWGTDVGVLSPKQYRVYWLARIKEDKEERSVKLRGLAEGLMRADEEGMWRDKEMRERDETEEREWRDAQIKEESGLRLQAEIA